MTRISALLGTLLLGLATAAPAAMAGEFPERAVTLIVPYAAGGGPDVQARQFAPRFSAALGVPVVVENRVGAAGVVAAQSVNRAPPDGYTILLGTNSHLVQKHLQPTALFDPIADFSGVSRLVTSPAVLMVGADSSARTLEDLLRLIAERPGQLNYSSGGVGTSAHIAGASLLRLRGLEASHIPLRGSVEITASLVRGDTAFAFPIAGTAIPQLDGGRVRALAVTSEKRLQALPEVPTLFEKTGEALLVQDSWFGLWVPKNTPADTIAKLHKATLAALDDDELRKQFIAGGSVPAPSASPAQFDAFVLDENRKWGELAAMLDGS